MQDEVFEGGPSTPVPKATLYETMRAGSYTAIFESLQAQLKTRDGIHTYYQNTFAANNSNFFSHPGEVVQLQHELEKQGKSRDSLVKELTEITKSNQELRSRLDSLESVRNECDDMTTKYNALLQVCPYIQQKKSLKVFLYCCVLTNQVFLVSRCTGKKSKRMKNCAWIWKTLRKCIKLK